METEVKNDENEKKIIIYMLKNYLISSKKIHDFIEEYSIYWNDDLLVVYNQFIEKLHKSESLQKIKLFRQTEDQLFATQLLTETIKREKETSVIIYDLAKNWDKDRIALSDLILMKMAVTEMMYIKNIPNKVSLDEYIEISKEYSTPRSKEFINGILDVFIKDILPKYNCES